MVKDMKNHLIGVDIGGTSIKIGIFDFEGRLINKWDIPTNKLNHGEDILHDIYNSILERTSFDDVFGIGFGVPGPVSNEIALNCVNLGWNNKHLVEDFRKILSDENMIIRLANDANCACAGEVFQGSAKGFQNVAMFTLGTGVGGGILQNGTIVEGVNGLGGEPGHIVVDFLHKFPCNCGKKGCLETVSSATGIVNLAKEKLTKTKRQSALRNFANFSAKRVFDLAKQGDQLSIDVIDEAANYLAYAMSMIALTTNPELFVIGGGVSNAGEYLLNKIKDHFYSYVNPFIRDQKIVIASLGNDAGIYGAAYMVKP
jgi:glucokinase